MPLRKIYLELTNKCNLNCTICYRQSWSEKPKDMDADLFHKIAAEISEIGNIRSVVLGGIGEPTCAPLIREAIRVFAKYDMTLTTNAVSIDQELLEEIAANLNAVMVSIDGLYENFSKIRGTNLDVVLENIKRINMLKSRNKSNSPALGIQFVISKDNIGDVFDLIDLAYDINVNTIVLSNLIPQTKENADRILYTRYENKEMKQLYSKALNYSLRKGISIILPNYELKTERRCSFIDDDTTYITADGDVVPCYRLSHCYKEYVFGREKAVIKHTFGNLRDNRLSDIWDSREYSSFRNTVGNNRYPSCIDCDLVEGCDMVKDTASDCYAGSPSCADCLWTRKFTVCP